LTNQLNELQTKPTQTKEFTQVISPEWRKMKTKVDYAQKKYDDLENQISLIEGRIKNLEKGFNFGVLGILSALGISGIILGLWRIKSSVKPPLMTILWPLLLLIVSFLSIVFIVCSYFGKQHNKNDEDVQKEIQQHKQTLDPIYIMLEKASEELADLKGQLAEIPEFESEVIRTTNNQFGTEE
jgi:septal ring factor EnvC (AmiA/AmiB activator)